MVSSYLAWDGGSIPLSQVFLFDRNNDFVYIVFINIKELYYVKQL